MRLPLSSSGLPLVRILAAILPAIIMEPATLAVGQTLSDLPAAIREVYVISRDVVYSDIDTVRNRLDVALPRDGTASVPALVWFHGGGWSRGTKDSSYAIPRWFMKEGWVIVNADYRLAPAAPAPAAVEDARCVLRWVSRHATALNVDPDRIVVGGGSAGGHLALMAGMVENGTGVDLACPGDERPRVAAILNFFGNADVRDMIAGPHRRGFAVRWIGERPDHDSMALAMSPVSCVRRGVPPVMTVHGDADSTVPYAQSVRLHESLVAAGVTQRLMTIPGGGHGKFSEGENLQIEAAVRGFLTTLGIIR